MESGLRVNGRVLERLARGKLHLAAERLLSTHELYAKLVARGTFIASGETRTMGVTVRGGALQFLYDPRFVAQCRVEDLASVIEHELLHVLFGHLSLDRAKYPDADALLIATESTVNENVTGPLPGQPITIEAYDLPADESTDERYARLIARRTAIPPRHAPKRDETVPLPSAWVPDRTDSVHGATDSGPNDANAAPPPPESVDDHAVWATPSLEERWAISHIVRTAVDVLDPGAASRLPRAVRSLIASQERGGPRRTTLPLADGVDGALQTVLRRFARQTHSWRVRDRRRHAEIAPGIVRERLRVLLVVDTSGSMDEAALASVNAALRTAAREHDVWLVQCDHTIRRIDRYRTPLTEIVGRGGTDLRPPFDACLLRALRPSLIVYLTDGCGPAPDAAPPVPVIWLLPEGGSAPTAWGEVVRIDRDHHR